MAESPRCQWCGHFVPIGKGITALVIRTDGRKQHYCDKCLKMGAELKDGSVGDMMGSIKEHDTVKEFKMV